MPEPVKRRDPLRPLLGAGTCALLYWLALNLVVPMGRFLGGEMVAITVPPLVAAAISGALAMAIFESRGFGDLGIAWHEGTGRNFLWGCGLGVGAAALVILPAIPLGLAHYEALHNPDIGWRAALFMPVLLFCGAVGEEIAFRGFFLQYLMRGYGAWAAILGVGALFGITHAANPGATSLGLLNTAIFGIIFGAAVLRTHDIWLAAGMHFGWNVILPFLGVELSGLTIRVTEYRLVWKAGILWSGGDYGPEASVLTSVVLVLLALSVWKAPVRKGWAYLLDGEQPAQQPSA
ncbi:MAG TPA: CPBP family intramembrane glutamic endopeptidase [Bryobacteraceae bacterium]|nr:CPBP family intramembrane glutamic endopeptidase [Bryobacteraceae bacterium]